MLQLNAQDTPTAILKTPTFRALTVEDKRKDYFFANIKSIWLAPLYHHTFPTIADEEAAKEKWGSVIGLLNKEQQDKGFAEIMRWKSRSTEILKHIDIGAILYYFKDHNAPHVVASLNYIETDEEKAVRLAGYNAKLKSIQDTLSKGVTDEQRAEAARLLGIKL